ncbi:MAG: VWA domain-containing protein [Acidobacteriota bacterium]
MISVRASRPGLRRLVGILAATLALAGGAGLAVDRSAVAQAGGQAGGPVIAQAGGPVTAQAGGPVTAQAGGPVISQAGGQAVGQPAAQGTGQASRPPADPQSAEGQPPQRPVFRAGANAVRVDVFATKKGVPVEDLTVDDFEVLEDNAPQKVDAFEHITIQSSATPETRVEPRNMRESDQMAADPRARVFVLFLDVYHVHQAASHNVTRPLMNLLNRVVGDQDLIAVMSPDMSAAGIMFTRRTDRIAQMLASFRWWGQRGREGFTDDPVEQKYMNCYPPATGAGATSFIAQEMIERRREKNTLDALRDLVRHLHGIREERKAILLVSEGWRLFRPDPSMLSPNTRTTGGGVAGTGYQDKYNPYGINRTVCDQDRMMLSGLDDERYFRDIMDEANLANASFYPIEPRGLPVFDNDIGPNPPPSPSDDFTMLQGRHDALMTIAANTDGIAVINSNDIDGGLKRVVADLSSYYLLGYTSTNSKLDGKFRAIKVRVKRPGIDVRARRGYKAPTAEEAAARTAAVAPVVDEATAAIGKTIATLDASTRDAPLRVSVSPGWWTPSADGAIAKPAGSEPALWIMGEVDIRAKTGDDWSRGGDADVAITGKDGEAVVRYSVPIPPGSGRFLTRFPRTGADVWLDPGSYAVKVRVTPATGGLPITETSRFDVAAPVRSDALLVGQPIYFRRGSAASSPETPTTDRRFRRTERIVVQMSASLAPEQVSGELVGRSGKTMEVPVAATIVEKDSVRWIRVELALAPLAMGDYVIRITTVRGTQKLQMLAPFRIVP